MPSTHLSALHTGCSSTHPQALHLTESRLLCAPTSHTVSHCHRFLSHVLLQWAATPLRRPRRTDFLPGLQALTAAWTPIPVVCLFILILTETLTLGNRWGDANNDHVWDGPQQEVTDCPLGPAQLNQPLPSPCQPGCHLGATWGFDMLPLALSHELSGDSRVDAENQQLLRS